jgi:4-hydroxy-tetrahydrodipicolinate reductase
MPLNVCVAGATGWVGKPLCRAIAAAGDLRLVGAVARTQQGARLGDVIGDAALDVTVSGSVIDALAAARAAAVPTDVLVDYTRADAVKANVLAAIGRGVHVVIGTSGLTDADYAEIDAAARAQGVGVIAAGNFAITAVLLQRFACEAAKYLAQWEIIDYASATKPDAPSGTARELAFRLGEIKPPQPAIPLDQTIGPRESRGATLNGSQVHSLRLPSYVIAIEAIFGADDERLTIRHDAGAGAEPYIGGTLLAVRKVREHVGLVRGLDRIMTE